MYEDYDVCDLKMAVLTDDEIINYAKTGDWKGKSGGFGV